MNYGNRGRAINNYAETVDLDGCGNCFRSGPSPNGRGWRKAPGEGRKVWEDRIPSSGPSGHLPVGRRTRPQRFPYCDSVSASDDFFLGRRVVERTRVLGVFFRATRRFGGASSTGGVSITSTSGSLTTSIIGSASTTGAGSSTTGAASTSTDSSSTAGAGEGATD